MSKLSDIINDNFTVILLLIGAGALSVQQGYVELPNVESPESTGVILLAVFAVGIGGYIAAGKIENLLPDPRRVYLIALGEAGEPGGEVWELTPDMFEAMNTVEGELLKWPVGAEVYEVSRYNEETNTAVASYRGELAESSVRGGHDLDEVLDLIQELRQEYAPAHRRLHRLRRKIRSVTRTLDRRRLKDANAMLDPTVTPEFNDEEATVSAVLKDELPPDLLPEDMKDDQEGGGFEGDGDRGDQGDEPEGFADMSILDDTDPLKND